MKSLLQSLILVTTTILTYSTVQSTSTNGNLNPLFLLENNPSEESVHLSEEQIQAKNLRIQERRAKVASNHDDYTSFIDQSLEIAMNLGNVTEDRRLEIASWLTDKYIHGEPVDLELHQKNIMDKCVYANPLKPTQCWECIDGYGPYPVNQGDYWECRPCNVTIDLCLKCIWTVNYSTIPLPMTIYGCQNCTKGYYPANATRIERQYHRGDYCT